MITAPKRYWLKKSSKTKITDTGRICTKCWCYKKWIDFSKDKNHKTWYSTQCLECRNKYKLEYRKKEWIREKELQYKKEHRTKEKTKLDNIYYQDKQIIKNREILKQFKSHLFLRKEAKENKINYFLNRWYDLNYLKKIFNF